jgi:ribosomal protein L37E
VHTFSTHPNGDEAGHWSACTQCGLASESTPHIPGAAATEEQPQLCAICGWELAPKLVHTHNYAPTVKDALSHSMVCACGAHLEDEGHSWDVAALRCSVCGFSLKETLPTLFLLCIIPAIALLFGMILLIHRLKSRFR